MSATTQRRRRSDVPATRVISPSPTPSERQALDGGSGSTYSGPVTRSARKRLSTPQPVAEEADGDPESADDTADRRPRTRSRSPIPAPKAEDGAAVLKTPQTKTKTKPAPVVTNGHLQPPNATGTIGGWSWRDFSRSPSPLGLIPVHRHWRSFVHRHEVPRKVLHVSIGFLVAWLYASGTQTRAVCPFLMGGLVPIATVDLLRHRWAALNRLYVRVLGALMRESEFDGYNGVIFYLLGAWIVLYALPKDVAVVSVMLLSWCDTAASTFGRLYGRYTPRLRRNKSLAGSTAALLVGVATATWFWGWFAPTIGPMPGDDGFQFRGDLGFPAALVARGAPAGRVHGALALGIISLWSGFVAAASEVVDLFGWDDNLTIPVLSGAGIWAFLRVFG